MSNKISTREIKHMQVKLQIIRMLLEYEKLDVVDEGIKIDLLNMWQRINNQENKEMGSDL